MLVLVSTCEGHFFSPFYFQHNNPSGASRPSQPFYFRERWCPSWNPFFRTGLFSVHYNVGKRLKTQTTAEASTSKKSRWLSICGRPLDSRAWTTGKDTLGTGDRASTFFVCLAVLAKSMLSQFIVQMGFIFHDV